MSSRKPWPWGHRGVPALDLDLGEELGEEYATGSPLPTQLAGSAFAGLLDPQDDRTVIVLPAAHERDAGRLSARERAAIRWAT
jgi:hypothetical protein